VVRVGGDRVRVEVGDQGRAAELAREPIAERAKDRRVLPPGARRRSPGGDPLRLPEQVALLQPGRRRRRGRDHHRIRELVGDRGVDELELELDNRLGGAKDELLLAHRPALFVKTRISGHVKPDLGRLCSITSYLLGCRGRDAATLGNAETVGLRELRVGETIPT
jgi:hypothetical protein